MITPARTWHEHGNEGDAGPAIWQDGLDIPFVNAMEASFYEVHPDDRQTPEGPTNRSTDTYRSTGLLPESGWDKPYSPLLLYPWERTYDALVDLAGAEAGSPFDGDPPALRQPPHRRHVMPTMGAQIQRLAPDQATQAHRHTGSSIYTVAKGSGHSIMPGRRLDWQENDMFCVPSWAWHEHANDSASEDACLFSFNDLPVMRHSGCYREQPLSENDGHQDA